MTELISFLVGIVIGGGVILHVVRRYSARDGTIADFVRRAIGTSKE